MDTIVTDTISFSPPDRENLVQDILIRCGYPSPERADRAMHQRARDAASLALGTIKPRSLAGILPLGRVAKGMIEAGGRRINSARLACLAASCGPRGMICLFAGTLGSGFDDAAKRAHELSMADALFLDSAGSVLAEHFAGLLEENIRLLFREQHLDASLRFSPGYCDWETGGGQEMIFSLIDPRAIGIKLTESRMMVPVKSISGVILGGERLSSRTPCPSCGRKDCPDRRD